MDDKGQHLDLFCDPVPAAGSTASGSRPFLGIHFMCCDVYARIYPNREATAYIGNCPRCAKRVHLRIGSGGTDARFFNAS